jgi:hypothetical protein
LELPIISVFIGVNSNDAGSELTNEIANIIAKIR